MDHTEFAKLKQQSDWLYMRLYVGNGDSTDEALPIIHEWLSVIRRNFNIDRWYFLRYIDVDGHHIRLRVRADPDVIDQLYLLVPELEKKLIHTPQRSISRVIYDPLLVMNGGRTGITFGVYSPEYLKYGGIGRMDSVEQHFGYSSMWCLEQRIWEISDPVMRVALAGRYLAEVFGSFIHNFPENSLFSEHTHRWVRRIPRALRLNNRYLESLVEQVVASSNELVIDTRGLLDSLLNCINGSFKERCSNNWTQQLMDLVHMDLNRIGVNVPEECLAGLAAPYIKNINEPLCQRKGVHS